MCPRGKTGEAIFKQKSAFERQKDFFQNTVQFNFFRKEMFA